VEEEASGKTEARLAKLGCHVSSLRPSREFTFQDKLAVREYKSLQALYGKLAIFAGHMDESWIFQEQKNSRGRLEGWVFQPTWLSPALSQEYFFKHGDRFVFMSATFPPKAVLAQMLGLNAGDMDYLEIPSTFPASNRPVLLQPVANMNHKNYENELPKVLNQIQKILDKHPREKGIIHTVSWKLNEAVRTLGDPRLIFHNSIDKNEVLERFSESAKGVFVSPSSTRGLDLPDDLCRFVIIAKAPFQSLGDKLVSSRVYGGGLGAFWYRAICAQDLVQASGRGVRHKDDYCVTYLLDKQIEKLVVDNQNLFPRYWIEAVDYAEPWNY
jgi:Rad3-related DNA helicase